MLVKYDIPEVREVSKRLPGARDFAVIEYGPLAIHDDTIQPQNYDFLSFCNSVLMLSGPENYHVGTRICWEPANGLCIYNKSVETPELCSVGTQI